MPLLNSPTVSCCPLLFSKPQGLTYRGLLGIEKEQNVYSQTTILPRFSRNLGFVISAGGGKSGSSLEEYDVPFPSDYTELLHQAKEATELAIKDDRQLMEIEFPTAGLDSVPGDGEGGIEMTGSMQLIREFCDLVVRPEKYTRTRIFFPEASEVTFARKSAFGGSSLKLDYLTKPSFFEDFGFVSKVKMTDRVKAEDELFLVGYPYFNVNEMLVVEELYKEAVVNTSRKLIIFNGELDRIRSGYYPAFFYPKLAALSQTFLPKMETVYYIHNFKGRNGGVLFRCYPGPWKVLRKLRNKYYSVHEQEDMPSLKEVALDILPSA
ncbi:hypothetical protein Salat_1829900 [Sesamum alatum]|uniref:DUF1995 domain-containing protein n=1 Tax=Sesamum alatum TaxID=300844 RepID=A0AAE1Y3B8_9LAMI|nr:hypothetical protein Salat_1829900 [Sesamum alatum]